MTGTDAATSSAGAREALARAFREAPALLRGFPVTLLLMTVGTLMQIAVPIAIQQMMDGEILAPGGVDAGGVLRLGAVALAAIVVAALARRLGLVRMLSASATGLSDLRVLTFRHLHRLSILHVEAERRGALVSRVTSDIATIQDFMDFGGV